MERVRDELSQLSDDGVVALGHPSTISIGKDNNLFKSVEGVYNCF